MTTTDLIFKTRKIPKKFSKQLLKQKHLSPKQVSLLTGKTPSLIINLSIPRTYPASKGAVLTRVYPFPFDLETEHSGPIFIQNDEKCETYIRSCNQ